MWRFSYSWFSNRLTAFILKYVALCKEYISLLLLLLTISKFSYFVVIDASNLGCQVLILDGWMNLREVRLYSIIPFLWKERFKHSKCNIHMWPCHGQECRLWHMEDIIHMNVGQGIATSIYNRVTEPLARHTSKLQTRKHCKPPWHKFFLRIIFKPQIPHAGWTLHVTSFGHGIMCQFLYECQFFGNDSYYTIHVKVVHYGVVFFPKLKLFHWKHKFEGYKQKYHRV